MITFPGAADALGMKPGNVEVPSMRSPLERKATGVPEANIGFAPRTIDCPSIIMVSSDLVPWIVCPSTIVLDVAEFLAVSPFPESDGDGLKAGRGYT